MKFTSLRRMLGGVSQRVVVGVLALSGAGLVGIANRESFRAEPYRDGATVWTDGYGNTNNVKPGVKVTPERALAQLLTNANTATKGVQACVTAPLYQHEFDVYVMLAFNIGVGGFCKSSRDPAKPALIDLINAQRYEEACDRLLSFNKLRNAATGQLEVSPGLTKARERERHQCRGEPLQ